LINWLIDLISEVQDSQTESETFVAGDSNKSDELIIVAEPHATASSTQKYFALTKGISLFQFQ